MSISTVIVVSPRQEAHESPELKYCNATYRFTLMVNKSRCPYLLASPSLILQLLPINQTDYLSRKHYSIMVQRLPPCPTYITPTRATCLRLNPPRYIELLSGAVTYTTHPSLHITNPGTVHNTRKTTPTTRFNAVHQTVKKESYNPSNEHNGPSPLVSTPRQKDSACMYHPGR